MDDIQQQFLVNWNIKSNINGLRGDLVSSVETRSFAGFIRFY